MESLPKELIELIANQPVLDHKDRAHLKRASRWMHEAVPIKHVAFRPNHSYVNTYILNPEPYTDDIARHVNRSTTQLMDALKHGHCERLEINDVGDLVAALDTYPNCCQRLTTIRFHHSDTMLEVLNQPIVAARIPALRRIEIPSNKYHELQTDMVRDDTRVWYDEIHVHCNADSPLGFSWRQNCAGRLFLSGCPQDNHVNNIILARDAGFRTNSLLVILTHEPTSHALTDALLDIVRLEICVDYGSFPSFAHSLVRAFCRRVNQRSTQVTLRLFQPFLLKDIIDVLEPGVVLSRVIVHYFCRTCVPEFLLVARQTRSLDAHVTFFYAVQRYNPAPYPLPPPSPAGSALRELSLFCQTTHGILYTLVLMVNAACLTLLERVNLTVFATDDGSLDALGDIASLLVGLPALRHITLFTSETERHFDVRCFVGAVVLSPTVETIKTTLEGLVLVPRDPVERIDLSKRYNN